MSGGLVWGGVSISQLARQYDTPLYVYDASLIRSRIDALRDALCDRVEIYYSVKANPNPNVVRVCAERGLGCEIASAAEYDRARAAGCPAERIVFAGPAKGERDLVHVIERGIGQVHVESTEEIAMLGVIAQLLTRDVDVAIRVNPVRSAAGGAMQMGGQPSPFGIDEERLAQAVALVRAEPRLLLRGLHQFAGTQILDARLLVAQWRHAISLGQQLAELTGKPPHTIDLGGGLGIPYFAHETALDLVLLRAELRELLASLPPALADTRLLVEPGRFLVGPCGIYVTRVRSVKVSRETTFAIVDGGMHHHLAAAGSLGQVIKRDYPIINASRVDDDRRDRVVIAGCLCTPLDTLARNATIAPVRPGDLVAIMMSGAYGLTASPSGFLSHPMPAELLLDQGQARVIRARGTFEAPLVQLPIA